MERVSGFYLFEGGRALRPLEDLHASTKYSVAQYALYIAKGWLEPIVQGNSLFKIRTAWAKGNDLLNAMNGALAQMETVVGASPPEEEKELGWMTYYSIKAPYDSFVTVLGAEWSIADLFLVSKLPGYDTTDLIESGWVLFPADMRAKVPEAINDANQAGKCLAFRLPTAAGFHLHRVNETILRRYYDAETKGKPRPTQRTIGAYLKAFEKYKAGDPKVLAALDSLRELHRNPLMHPEQILENFDEAIALHGAVHSVVVHMLKKIPLPAVVASGPAP